MTLGEIKKAALSIIEEINPKSAFLTDDEDIKNKINFICNLIQIDLAQVKKINKKQIIEITSGTKEVTLPSDFYQLNKLDEDIDYEIIGNVLYLKDDYEGNITMFYYAYPSKIDDDTANTYELEIDLDAQNAMVFGVISDILKADISSDYSIYEAKYQNLKANLNTGKGDSISVVGGIEL